MVCWLTTPSPSTVLVVYGFPLTRISPEEFKRKQTWKCFSNYDLANKSNQADLSQLDSFQVYLLNASESIWYEKPFKTKIHYFLLQFFGLVYVFRKHCFRKNKGRKWWIFVLNGFAQGPSINHVVKILGTFDPLPPWSLLLIKAYDIKWSFGQPPPSPKLST